MTSRVPLGCITQALHTHVKSPVAALNDQDINACIRELQRGRNAGRTRAYDCDIRLQ
jgi:hypothetical protein